MGQDARPSKRAIVWCQPNHSALVEKVRAQCDLTIVSAGCPTSGGAAELADRLGSRKCSDLRHDVTNEACDLLVLLTLDGVERGEHFSWLDGAGQVVTLEPMFEGMSDYTERSAANKAILLPAFRNGESMRIVDDWRESFGAVRSAALTLRGGAGQGSLYAHLVDGVDIIERLCGNVEMVDAAMSGPTDNQGATARSMHGHISVNARFSSNCCASVHVSDAGGGWSRGLTVLGEGGCLRLTDEEAQWTDHDGVERERSVLTTVNDEGDLFSALVCRSICSVLDSRGAARAPHPTAGVLATCEAIRLSLKTGQGESPRKMLSLMA